MVLIGFLSFFLIVLGLLLVGRKSSEQYGSCPGMPCDHEYDYAMEKGVNVAGTVYAANPSVSGGLGWIL